MLKKLLRQGSGVALIASTVGALAIALRLAGLLQILEWAVLDSFFRLRPTEPIDPRIVIVAVDESDIINLGGWPMSDAVLAQLIQQIQAQKPIAIGLDLYRDLAVEPGHQTLLEVYRTTPNLIGIEKVARETIAPPPILSQRDRVGIADVIIDPDGKVRRAFLSIRPPDRPAKLSLGAKLALIYLERKGITPELIGRNHRQPVKLGPLVIRRFTANDGAYVRANSGGYQILLNFRGLQNSATMISLTDVLNQKIPANLMRDRIVLIGVTARSLNDFFYTPYSYDDLSAPAGVQIHAHVISHLLSATLDGRPILQTWNETLECLWILLWAITGSVLGSLVLRDRRVILAIFLVAGGLGVSCYGLFLFGWWLPLIPALIAIAIASVCSSSYVLWQNLKLSHQQLEEYARTLEEKVQQRTQTLQQRTLELKQKTAQLEQQTLELESAKDAAEAANRAKTTFLANISHELRTPLNAILGFSQLMARSSSLVPEHQDSLNIICRSGEHLLMLINNVLDLAKIEAGRATLQKRVINLDDFLNDLVKMFQWQIETKQLQFIFAPAPTLPHFIQVDDVKLRQVLINLIGNAIKFTQTGSITLQVQTYSENSASECDLFFSIADTGPGIAPEELPKLFEPFVQTKTGQQDNQGTGLGLAISRQFIQLMDGDISVHSNSSGTRFDFNIRVSVVEEMQLPSTCLNRRAIALDPHQPAYRILIVDDHIHNRFVLAKLLSQLGFEICEASNGLEAVTLWESWQPHLIWMDLQMPLMDGIEATQQIRQKEQAIAPPFTYTIIIALSAVSLPEIQAIAKAAGCDDFLHKPFWETEILDTMNKYISVRYIEQSDGNAAATLFATDDSVTVKLSPVHFAALPDTWVANLYHAAAFASPSLALSLIEQIQGDYPILAEALTQLVNHFQFDTIIELTQRL